MSCAETAFGLLTRIWNNIFIHISVISQVIFEHPVKIPVIVLHPINVITHGCLSRDRRLFLELRSPFVSDHNRKDPAVAAVLTCELHIQTPGEQRRNVVIIIVGT